MTTLVDAIEQKFDLLIESSNGLKHVTLYGSPTVLKRQFYTASGSLCLPPVLVMDNSGVSTLGDLEKLSQMCSHVTELDLCNNQLADWASLFDLLVRLPRLRWLNLSINPHLKPPQSVHTTMVPPDCLAQLAILVLNKVPLTWPLLAAILSAAPNVSELYLCNNSDTLRQLPDEAPADGYPGVKQLFFNGNRIQPVDWARLAAWFPRLEKLTLIGNGLSELPDCEGAEQLLAGLKSLNLSENGIASWGQLEKLNAFPGLTDLRVLDIDLAKGRPKGEFRSEAVARLPHVTQLNGTPVSDDERCTAERACIRRYAHSTPPPSLMSEGEQPPPADRLAALEAKHGRLDELANVCLKPADSVNLVLRYGDQSRACAVPTDQSVRDVKRLVCAQFHLEPAKVNMYYVDQGMIGAYGPEALNMPGRAFHSYRPEDGDELVLRDRN